MGIRNVEELSGGEEPTDPEGKPPDPDKEGLIPITPHENQDPVPLEYVPEEVEPSDDSE